jgi:hypothetical protein
LNVNDGLIPPVNEQTDAIGNENKARKTNTAIEAASFPHIISKGESNVMKRPANVLFSLSEGIAVAVKAGTRRINNVKFTLKKRVKILLPLSDATESTPPLGHSKSKAEERRIKYPQRRRLVRRERAELENSRRNMGLLKTMWLL